MGRSILRESRYILTGTGIKETLKMTTTTDTGSSMKVQTNNIKKATGRTNIRVVRANSCSKLLKGNKWKFMQSFIRTETSTRLCAKVSKAVETSSILVQTRKVRGMTSSRLETRLSYPNEKMAPKTRISSVFRPESWMNKTKRMIRIRKSSSG